MPSILLTISMVFIGMLGFISTNFGYHWDEEKLIKSVQNSLDDSIFLPRWYNYPSVSFDIAVLSIVPNKVGQTIFHQGTTPIISKIDKLPFHLQLRFTFFLLSIFSAIPVYIFIRQLLGNSWIALFAGITSISTWEFIYHARWIAPDCILALFISWSLMSQYQILRSENRSQYILWVVISAIFAGLCIGTKYTGGIVLIPLFIAVSRKPEKSKILLVSLAGLISLLVFVFTTPGFYIEPFSFWDGVQHEIHHYSNGHRGYTVAAGGDHFSKLFFYLVVVFLSRNPILAIGASGLVGLGAIYLLRKYGNTSFWFLSLPILYILYMSSQKVMIVRNNQLLLPYFASLMGVGLFAIISIIQKRSYKRYIHILLYILATFFVIYNLTVATESALSIFRHQDISIQSSIESQIISNPKTKFLLSPQSLKIMGADKVTKYPNIVTKASAADKLIYVSYEGKYLLSVANTYGRYTTIWSCVDEVNWDYYPTWEGHYRVLEISAHEQDLKPLISSILHPTSIADPFSTNSPIMGVQPFDNCDQ